MEELMVVTKRRMETMGKRNRIEMKVCGELITFFFYLWILFLDYFDGFSDLLTCLGPKYPLLLRLVWASFIISNYE